MRALPEGTVTLMLTDVAHSSRLWEEHPSSMLSAVEVYWRVFREAVTTSGGHVVRARLKGDSSFAVFESATRAVRCGLQLQRVLSDQAWPDGVPLQVRLGVHTGEVDLVDDDYFGPAVNRCARIRDIGYGGQILLSQATAALVGSGLPDGARLVSLGRHRLRDLQAPEHVYQLEHPDIRSDYPPPRSLNSVPNNLPAPLTRLVDRELEIQQCIASALTGRLITLTGVGGAGKTRLAIQLAAELMMEFPDGIWYVELDSINDPDDIPNAVANALDLDRPIDGDTVSVIGTHVRDSATLLVLDNCEHQIEAVSRLVHRLLERCPNLTVIVTSREPMHLAGEILHVVGPLEVPDSRGESTSKSLLRHAAMELFVERARESRQGYILTDVEADIVSRLVRQLGGLPLTIELAAARMRVMSSTQILNGVRDSIDLLERSGSGAERHRTLRAAVRWSTELLSPLERLLFQRCAEFVSWFNLDAAVMAYGESDRETVNAALYGLVEKSLLQPRIDPDLTWYKMIEPVRLAAADLLLRSGETEGVRLRLLEHYAVFADALDDDLAGAESTEPLRRSDLEYPTILSLLRWCADGRNEDRALTLAPRLWRYWLVRGKVQEGVDLLETLLARGREDAAQEDVAYALQAVGALTYHLGDMERAWSASAEALKIQELLRNHQRVTQLLSNLGNVARARGRLDQAADYQNRVLELARQSGDPSRISLALYNLGLTFEETGEYAKAQAVLLESIDIRRREGDSRREAMSRWALALVLRRLGELKEARRHLEYSLESIDEDSPQGSSIVLSALAELDALEGHYYRGRKLARSALDDATNRGDAFAIGESNSILGEIATSLRQYSKAGQHHQRALELYRAKGLAVGTAGQSTKLAFLALLQRSPADALRWASEAYQIASALSDRRRMADARLVAALAHLDRREEALAAGAAAECLRCYADLDSRLLVADGLHVSGRIAHAHGEHVRAAALLGAAEEIWRACGVCPKLPALFADEYRGVRSAMEPAGQEEIARSVSLYARLDGLVEVVQWLDDVGR